MEIVYPYFKKRKDFGCQPMFCEVPVHFLDTMAPDATLYKHYGLRNPVNRNVQATTFQSEHYVNTKRVTLTDVGINHSEGGWPKEINCSDEDATLRLRRRVERDDAYVEVILNAYPKLERCIKQNNAIDMYTMYFRGMQPEEPIEKSSVVIKNIFREPYARPVSCINWTQEEDTKLVVAYCDQTYPLNGYRNMGYNTECYLWNMENPNKPSSTLNPPSPCWQLVCSPVSPSSIIGGLEDGRVCVFDIRTQQTPIAVSPMHLAHRDPITALLYIQSRLNTEFFSGSTDGCCIWWDLRDLSKTTDLLPISVRLPPGESPNLGNAEGINTLQFDRAFPTRFLCGTDTGLVINVNRKGKTQQETMSSVFKTHLGPVKAVHRSPLTSKMFITCGDWRVNIWSDDVLSSPIICGTSHRYKINDVAWATQRISSYMSIGADGMFRFWDLLRKYSEPINTFPVSEYSLLKLKPHEEGRLVAVGDTSGSIYILSLSDNLVISGSRDKQLMLQNYERETRRERILETRVKEIRLKLKAAEEETGDVPLEIVDEDALVRTVEDDYKKAVSDEIRRREKFTPDEKYGTERRR